MNSWASGDACGGKRMTPRRMLLYRRFCSVSAAYGEAGACFEWPPLLLLRGLETGAGRKGVCPTRNSYASTPTAQQSTDSVGVVCIYICISSVGPGK